MNFYELHAFDGKYNRDYIRLKKEDFKELIHPCRLSEFQFIDKSLLTVELENDSGSIWPDFILYDDVVPIVSDRMKSFLDEQHIDYLFYKKIILTQKTIGREEVYWLALPFRINCLNKKESEIDFSGEATFIKINEDYIGRYKIFKITGIVNNTIVITEDFANLLKVQDFEGVDIYELNKDE